MGPHIGLLGFFFTSGSVDVELLLHLSSCMSARYLKIPSIHTNHLSLSTSHTHTHTHTLKSSVCLFMHVFKKEIYF